MGNCNTLIRRKIVGTKEWARRNDEILSGRLDASVDESRNALRVADERVEQLLIDAANAQSPQDFELAAFQVKKVKETLPALRRQWEQAVSNRELIQSNNVHHKLVEGQLKAFRQMHEMGRITTEELGKIEEKREAIEEHLSDLKEANSGLVPAPMTMEEQVPLTDEDKGATKANSEIVAALAAARATFEENMRRRLAKDLNSMPSVPTRVPEAVAAARPDLRAARYVAEDVSDD